ncbi:hypothetical protein CDAR_390771 [Caerostris darwini]|uniref:Uncharacterized protein n=1 Tax=Caerostris darwini TaxID=1538125 RepID=A0AAV4TE10_9ARAC|nr:hypothetical protein CDAR_390771 [Caerostris darwini]
MILLYNKPNYEPKVFADTPTMQFFLSLALKTYIEIPWGVQKVQNSTLLFVLFRWILNNPFLHLLPVNKDCTARKLLRRGRFKRGELGARSFQLSFRKGKSLSSRRPKENEKKELKSPYFTSSSSYRFA